LISKTYSSKVINLKMYGGASGTMHEPERQQPDAWELNETFYLDKAYQLTGGWTNVQPRQLSDGGIEVLVSPDSEGSVSLFLDNTLLARTHDVQIVFSGAIMATGIAIFADLLIDIFVALGETPAKEHPLPNRLRPKIRRRADWRISTHSKKRQIRKANYRD
jgi:hypothetical protein